MTTRKEFKGCSSCGYDWITREVFLEDPSVDIIGYQPNFEYLEEGYFLFNHVCGTTLAIMTGEFKDIYNGQISYERLTKTENCSGYCLYKDNMDRCPAKCECAYIREIIQIIKHWPKRNDSPNNK